MSTVSTVVGLFSSVECAYLGLFLAAPVLVAVAGWLASRREPEEMTARQAREAREAGGAR
ncbi:hypothetical protein F4561_002163 [Lipingzhangella halophila]|uniref:Uncharacterized protein n=1 Tax=Lipingzhangella halophila TaxID=1783352 RepID=A0A7W7RGQ5_9ACTN|nr:hypothetical protein [Lipingzhangella halophila]MBB4931343.1 hypothetical protein [Lipingzhangella halophila]